MKLLSRVFALLVFMVSTFFIDKIILTVTYTKKIPQFDNDKPWLKRNTLYYSDKNLNLLPRYKGPGADGDMVKTDEDDNNYRFVKNKSLVFSANNFISDMIGIKRIQPDMRPDKCKEILYPDNLPAISIVIILREEPVVSLLRTVYSILETSPEKLVEEIILVDDGSKSEELIAAVDLHVANVNKLKLIRNDESEGLMMARQKGIENTQSEYFIVLDGHIEVTPGWLEPIIYRLIKEPKALLTSHIGIIYMDTFKFSSLKSAQVDHSFMAFDQITLNEEWVRYSEVFINKRNGSVSPIEYGMVPGMMMSMRKDFFLKLGGFDPGMEVWGAEHTEMSVKVWLCGGRVEMVPCSKIGHLYRGTPWQKFHPKKAYFIKNQVRFALVWMEGLLKDIVLEIKKSEVNMKDIGDISKRELIKTENHCHPYQYYIDKMLEISDLYIPTYVREKGIIKNMATNTCLDITTVDKKRLLISFSCHGNSNQYFILTEDFHIRIHQSWLTEENGKVIVFGDSRNAEGPKFRWKYNETKQVIHELTDLCLTMRQDGTVYLDTCSLSSNYQRWNWSAIS
ncbi:polypeptide N-acetylgalactosaminyltransferase [Mactra antiquata]